MESQRKTAFVTGATGSLGPWLIRGLYKEGWNVIAHCRDTTKRFVIPPGAITVSCSLDSPEIYECLKEVDVVFHLAGRVHHTGQKQAWEPYYRDNAKLTETVVNISVRAGVSRIVFLSSISVYGRSKPKPFVESDKPRPTTHYGKSKLAAEEYIRLARGTNGQPCGVILRLAAVYGPGMTGNYMTLARGLKYGLFRPIGDCLNRRTLIYIDDVVDATLVAATHPDAPGQIFNVTDGELHLFKDIIRAMSSALGKKTPLPLMKRVTAMGLAFCLDRFLCRNMPGLPEVTPFIEKMTEDVAVDGRKIRLKTGFKPQVRLKDGWAFILKQR